MRHHSALDGTRDDRVIIGATSMKHLEANAACFSSSSSSEIGEGSVRVGARDRAPSGPLPGELAQAFDDAWGVVRGVAPGYVRGVVLSSERPTDFFPEVTK